MDTMIDDKTKQSNVAHPVALLWTILQEHYVLLAFILVILHFLRRRYLSPLRDLPGPIIASCSRVWKVWSTARGHTQQDHIRLHQRYGPMVRIAPNEVSLSSPVAAREILSAGKGFHKTDFYAVFPPAENPDIFTETREAVHAQKKRVANVPYSMNTMQTMAGAIEDTEKLLFKKLDSFRDEGGKTCNLGDWLHYFAFDVLGEVAFSERFGFLEAGFDVEGAIHTIDNAQWYDGIVGQVPEFDHVLRRNPLWNLIPSLSTNQALITRMALEQMAARKKAGHIVQDRKDLLDYLLKAHEEKPDRFAEGDVFAVAHGAIFAGSDSTASTMQSFFHYVLRDPRVYKKILAEIDSAQRNNGLSAMISWSEAQDLQYFQACLKEAMRLRPAVGLNISRLVPPGGAEVGGRWFKGGTRLAVNGWVLHRDQSIFGPDVEAFRPERWLEDSDVARQMERHMFQFGGGAHLCIGRNLALLEMNKVLPQLLRDYHFELLHPDMELQSHTTFFVVQQGLTVRVSSRGHN